MRRPLALLLPLLALVAWGAVAQDAAPPLLALDTPRVEPAKPGVDTLCQLRVTLHNRGPRIASSLAFAVKINGEPLTVYGNQVFMLPVPAEGEAELRLYNFWTTETRRPAPKDGVLRLEVSLVEAQWMTIENDAEGVEVWTPQGPVEGLPVTTRLDIPLAGLAKSPKG